MAFRDNHRPTEVPFELVSSFAPAGDQPQAIEFLDRGLREGRRFQTLLGVTGSGKTFTIANVIARQKKRPTLIIAPNKTLAAQLYAEFKEFFPNNRVKYFVSYYDYYQPEAYVPSTDTYIEKDAAINDEIDKMRHGATRAVLEATDSIVVASVSCIYGLGAPEDYFNQMLYLRVNDEVARESVLEKLIYLQYKRTDVEFVRGTFRVRGESLDIFPSDEDEVAIRVIFFGDVIESISTIDSVSGVVRQDLLSAAIYPVSHYVAAPDALVAARQRIKEELDQQLPRLIADGKVLEAQRLERRTLYDLELLAEVGFCPGIENYSRHLAGRSAGAAPTTLLDYFPKDFLLVIDESHVTVSQIGGMYRGDRARKETLVNFGFRLPSALDNRPLNFEEFWERVGQTIFVSATPAEFEIEKSRPAIVQQVNRPTGLLDPEVVVRPALHQIDDLLSEIRKVVGEGDRVLVTTLTKKTSEDLSEYLRESGIRCRYLHSDIDAIERVEILRGLRRGDFDVLIGINLLREGLDLVEVALVAILDADKEGFLRSTRSLIQTMGRAARNLRGRVILYADRETDSMRAAIEETRRRRDIQRQFNERHGIVPRSAERRIERSLVESLPEPEVAVSPEERIAIPKDPKEQRKLIETLRTQMFDAAAKREFEHAAQLRDAINKLQQELLKR